MRKKRISIKNHSQESQLIHQRCLVLFFIMMLLASLIILRLAWLQLVRHTLFTTLSQKNWLDLVPIEPTRGLIYDRNGILLAENTPVFSLEMIPDKVNNIPDTLKRIQAILPLSVSEISQFQHQLRQHRRFDAITLRLRLSETEVARFAENQYRFPGVQIRARLIRHYPMGKTLSHALGYVGRINTAELRQLDPVNYSATLWTGKSGIEKSQEHILHGRVGYEQAENDASGQSIRVLNRIPPVPGKNLWLTLDSKLQLIAEEAFAGHRGALVALQPDSGEVLALVSEPGYDPDVFVTGLSSADYHTLQNAADRPLYNRAIRGTYAPGSTIKPYLALEGLDAGIITPDTTIYDPGWFQFGNGGHIFHDWRRLGHGRVNISRAITVSCDIFFYRLADSLGIQSINDVLSQFGFGQPTGVDTTGESAGVIASPAWKKRFRHEPWYDGDTIISGIGQGYMQFTPIQMAAGAAALATRGKRFQPHLLLAEGSREQSIASVPLSPIELDNPPAWEVVIEAMRDVILSREGTGVYHFGRPPTYTVAAKTGTSQLHSIRFRDPRAEHEDQDALPEKLRDNSVFIGFAPLEKPRIALAVVVENDSAAGQIARKVLDAYMGVTPA